MMFIKNIFLFARKHPCARLTACASTQHPGSRAGGLCLPHCPSSPTRGAHAAQGVWGSSFRASPHQLSQEKGFEDGFSQMGSLEVQRPRQPEWASGSAAFSSGTP